ncbi:hypothetical protein [Spirosoma foliorum]|uniref:Uncharacterized protein n=1 Tax=Spirosoma foliorum TaxID=2710596 RepID=A0A7G5H2I6_9BACT|nr:hypothetical protein [Spirosoma foliorum]QMW05328.1 hypothetical protein H3H32_10785 [Spirosoma foliorum]
MKKLLVFGLMLVLASLSANAQIISSITKVTAPTSATGSLVLEDTLAASTNYWSPRRGDVFVAIKGAGATAKLFIYSKGNNSQVLASALLSAIYVPLAGGNPSTQTSTQKATYLKANTN